MPERILVACPVHECKEYAFARWTAAVESLTYPAFDVLVVDNSPTTDFMDRWKARVSMVHVGADPERAMLRITQSMEVIRKHFLEGNYSHWFNLEADVIPPPDIIERLLSLGGNADWISHAYPQRGGDRDDQQGIGCSLLSRRMMQDFSFAQCGDNSPDGWLWAQVRPLRKYQVMELWGYFLVGHLGA